MTEWPDVQITKSFADDWLYGIFLSHFLRTVTVATKIKKNFLMCWHAMPESNFSLHAKQSWFLFSFKYFSQLTPLSQLGPSLHLVLQYAVYFEWNKIIVHSVRFLWSQVVLIKHLRILVLSSSQYRNLGGAHSEQQINTRHD